MKSHLSLHFPYLLTQLAVNYINNPTMNYLHEYVGKYDWVLIIIYRNWWLVNNSDIRQFLKTPSVNNFSIESSTFHHFDHEA